MKDPFIKLINQSVKTFLNAMTFPDKTAFPASSPVKADYFNLMSVYGDAVFFPNLSPEIFLQEAHRLELDKDGNYSIQGVVYNEMKGNYSSFDSLAGDAAVRSIFPNTMHWILAEIHWSFQTSRTKSLLIFIKNITVLTTALFSFTEIFLHRNNLIL